MTLKNTTLFYILAVTILIKLYISMPALSEKQIFDPINSEDSPVNINEISNNEEGEIVFHFKSKLLSLCNEQNICSEGTYNNFIPITSLIVFKGDKQPRYKKATIMWEVKFLESCPTIITYSQTPFTGKEIIKAQKLNSGEYYSICIYPKNGIVNCSKWLMY